MSRRFYGTLESPIVHEDYEETVEEWERVGKIHFSLEAARGSDSDSDQQVDDLLQFDCRTRYRSDMKPGMRINVNGRHLNISGPPIDADQKKRWLDFTCEELV